MQVVNSLCSTIASTVLVVCVLLFSVEVSANNLGEKRLVRVGYSTNDYIVSDIRLKTNEGYGYDILKKVESTSNIKFEFVEIKGSLFEALENGEVDITGSFFKSPEREEKYLFLETPLGRQLAVLAAKKEDQVYYNDLRYIDGKTVSISKGNPIIKVLEEYLNANNVSVKYIESERHEFLNVDADFYLISSGFTLGDELYSVLNLGLYDSYLVSNHDNAELMQEINEALVGVMHTEGDFLNDLRVKYADSEIKVHRDITREEANMLKGKTFTVGYAENHRPYTFTDVNGIPDGTSIELMNIIAEKYGFNVQYSPYKAFDNDSAFYTSDIIISVLGDSRREHFGYVPTEAYYHADLVAITTDDLFKHEDDLYEISPNINSAGVLKYEGINYDLFMSGGRSHVKLFTFETFDDLLTAYKARDVQVAIFTNNGLSYANAFVNRDDTHVIGLGYKLPLYFSISSSLASDYVPIFNVIFDNIGDDKYYDIMVGQMSDYEPKGTLLNFLKQYWYLFGALISTGLLIILLIILRGTRGKKQAIEHILDTDDVTGHISMHKFTRLAEEKLQDAEPDQYQLVSFDIDLFRTINTYYSIEKGTEVLNVISKVLADCFEHEDTIFTRKFADNFLVLRNVNELPAMRSIITHKIVPAVQETMGANYNFCMSTGVYIITDLSRKLSFMIENADAARRSGKVIHKTTYKEFDSSMQRAYETKLDVTYRMESALRDNEFYLVYQPKIDFEKLVLKGAEALVRWKTKDRKMFFPNDFIPEFEENGFVVRLDLYVFEEVCKFISANKDMNLPIISVNLSAKTFTDDNIVYDLIEIIEKYDTSPDKIELEITESAMNVSEEEIVAKVNYLKHVGFTISIDDFGAGVSSLNRLGVLNADVLKMDKAFLDNNTKNSNNSLVIENTIKLANQLGMKVVAEGIETLDQAKWLRSVGCNLAQGYFFEKPLLEDDFKNIIQSSKSYTLIAD